MPGNDGPSTEQTVADAVLRQKILELCGQRGPGKSICPSEVARALEDDEAAWRRLLKPVRCEAARLASEGRIEILKKGKPIAPESVKGVIRLRIADDSQA